ncbi:MAG: 50S ribosomal protein L3 [Chloroflexi bacterium]|nr:50S ribosomal protein L3 [Chloroflexota bacterium]
MITGIIGKKLGTTQIFSNDGTVTAVTAIEAGPCVVTQVKTAATDGYDAAQLGFGATKQLKSPEKGHLKGLGQFRYLREFRVDDAAAHQPGEKIDVSLFAAGDLVDVTGVSKGKGFAGGVKRYHFRGGPKTHGQSDRHRAPGSMGPDIPNRVLKGQRMAGHMGDVRVTARNLQVFQTDPNRNLLFVKGTVPGGPNGLLLIKKLAKRK